MLHSSRIFAGSLAVLVLFTAMAPAATDAWPFGRTVHLHPPAQSQQDARITFQLYNKSGLVQQVKVAGRVYTLMPHGGLTITAPQGTEVFALSKGFGHRKGDLLFAVAPNMKSDTLSID